jgi:ribosomal protein S18 acetylase RimI-like enzyme
MQQPAALTPVQARILAGTLPDSPQTVISISRLRCGLARAYVVGDVQDWETAVIDDPGQPGEPMAFGHNAIQIAELMAALPGWFCVNVATDVAAILGPLLADKMDCSIRYYKDIYHIMNTPAPRLSHPDIRRLTPDDLPLLQAAPDIIRGHDPTRILTEMYAAGAVVNGRVVAIAQNYAFSDQYGDVGVSTLPDFRGQGLATAAAALVARELQQNGRIPVWSCGEDNYASLRVAEKLGFKYDSQRTYIILEQEPAP